jgi:MYXO-CTERM domain-containing protein
VRPARAALRFEANEGQFDPTARYLARALGAELLLADAGATLTVGGTRLTFTVAGGRAVVPRASERIATLTHYFVGDRARWRTNVPNFNRVTYESVLDGVDVVYHGEDGALEYDVVVAPGVDPDGVILEVGGADGVSITPEGDLAIRTPGGDLRQPPPRVYQTTDDGRAWIRGTYRLAGPRAVAFEIASYDRARPLVIDPVLAYATYLDAGYGEGIAVDSTGHAFVTGYTTADGFATPGALEPSPPGSSDAFVAKLDPSGNFLVYATYLGGTDADDGLALAVDAAGHAYVTGYTNSADFPTAGAFRPRSGARDAFVTELSADGAALIYSTYLGGSLEDDGYGIAVDPSGHAYVAGVTGSGDFPVPGGLYPFTGGYSGDVNAFVAEVASDGSLVYATCLGGSSSTLTTGWTQGKGIAVDPGGNAYVTGTVSSAAFPLKNPIYPADVLEQAGFVTEIAKGGGELVFSTLLPASTSGESIALDPSGNVYVAGIATSGQSFPAKNPAQAPPPHTGIGGDLFVLELSPSSASTVYATLLGGSYGEDVAGLAVDARGTAYVTGYTDSPDFPVRNALLGTGFPTTTAQQAFVTAVAPSGGSFLYSSPIDGYQGNAIAADAVGNAYVTGYSDSANLPSCGGGLKGGLSVNAFVLKIAPDGQPVLPSACGATDAGLSEAGPSEAGSSEAGASDAALADGNAGATDSPSDAGHNAAGDAGAADSAPPVDAGLGPPLVFRCQVSSAPSGGGASFLLPLVALAAARWRRRPTPRSAHIL